MVALYRPGPMQWIDDFIDRKQGRKPIEYLHPAMKPALESTYGVIVTQEQVMQISKEMCGFTGGQADTLRKAIGKKIPEVMAKLKKDFIDGGIKTVGADRALMEKFWGQLEDFAAYCFNKAHSACYAMIAYQTAYLKAHYPDAFMASLMTSDYDNTDRLAIEITECKHMGIEVLSPDVNQSFHEFAVVPGANQIRFGLDAIKNVGHGAAEEVIRGREAAGGQFDSLEDFCKNVNARIVNRKAIESLVRAGAFDSFGDRSVLYNNIENILAMSSRLQKDALSGQVDLFGDGGTVTDMALKLLLDESGPEHAKDEQLVWERELLGLYLSHNPLEAYEKLLADYTSLISLIKPEHENTIVTVGGYVNDVREIVTKNGAKMAFVKIADTSGEIELVLFPRTFSQTEGLWQRDQVIVARGKIGSGKNANQGSELKVLVDDAKPISLSDAEAYAEHGKRPVLDFAEPQQRRYTPRAAALATTKETATKPQRLYIRLLDSSDQTLLTNLKQKLDGFKGSTEVVLVTGASDSKQVIKLPQAIDINEQSLRDLAGLFGPTNVVVK